MKQLAFSVTKNDLVVQTFRAGGKGGQNQNKRETGVRIIHPDSGAVGEARDGREQYRNKRKALERLVAHPKFKVWVHSQLAGIRGVGVDSPNTSMARENLKIEYRKNGQWIEVES